MKRWNQAPLIRDQVVLFSPTLDGEELKLQWNSALST